MRVTGKMVQTVDVEISFQEAIKAVAEFFGVPAVRSIYSDDFYGFYLAGERQGVDVDGIYHVEDTSYHGSPLYKYTLVSSDPEDIDAFIAVDALNKIVRERNSRKQDQGLGGHPTPRTRHIFTEREKT